MSLPNKEVNSLEPSPSARVPWVRSSKSCLGKAGLGKTRSKDYLVVIMSRLSEVVDEDFVLTVFHLFQVGRQ